MDMIERLKQATETCEEADRFALFNQNPSRFGELDQLVIDADNRCRDLVRRHGRELMELADSQSLEMDAVKAHAAVAELIEAADELKDVCNRPSAARTRAESWRRLDRALARVRSS